MLTNRARVAADIPGPQSRALFRREAAHLGNGLQSIALYSQVAIDHGEGSILIDVDGNSEDRSDTISVFNGPPPAIHSFKSESEEIKTVGNWIQAKRIERNLSPSHLAAKMGIATALVRSWENDECQPNERQQGFLAKLLEFSNRASHLSDVFV